MTAFRSRRSIAGRPVPIKAAAAKPARAPLFHSMPVERGLTEPRRSANHVFFALPIPDLCALWFDRGIMTTTEDTESTEERVSAPQSRRRSWPNQAASGNGAVASRVHTVHLRRAVPALRRSAAFA